MEEFWILWPKPWTQEQCYQYYVHGPEISLCSFEELAGRSRKTLSKWIKEHEWVKERVQYRQDLQKAVSEKTMEKTSDRLSDEMAQINEAHVRLHGIFRDITEALASELRTLLQQPDGYDQANDLLKTIDLARLDALSKIADRATKAERVALSMDYLDINRAIKVVQQAGFTIVVEEGTHFVDLSAQD